MEKIADKRNILEKLKPYQKKENDNLLKEYFDRWKNVTDKNKILRNMKSQKQLANTIGNVDESKKKNDMAQPVECNICHKLFKNGYILKTHLKNIHCEKREIFECPHCGKPLKSKYYLQYHISHKHNEK